MSTVPLLQGSCIQGLWTSDTDRQLACRGGRAEKLWRHRERTTKNSVNIAEQVTVLWTVPSQPRSKVVAQRSSLEGPCSPSLRGLLLKGCHSKAVAQRSVQSITHSVDAQQLVEAEVEVSFLALTFVGSASCATSTLSIMAWWRALTLTFDLRNKN